MSSGRQADPSGPARWRRVQELFHGAVELPLHAQHAFLESSSGGDANLVAEVEALLLEDRTPDSFLDRAWRQAIRSSTPLSLIMIDIDHFKNYNDTYGHQRGDECLKQVACALNQVLHRPTDFLARYGGEEFAAVLSDTDLRGAEVVASSLHAHVDELNIPHEFSPSVDHVTLSLGVASGFPYRTQSQQALIYAADLALYQAKHEGRNRIRIANEVMNSSLDEISVRRAAPVTISPRQSAVKPKGE